MEIDEVYRPLTERIEGGQRDLGVAEAQDLLAQGHTVVDIFQKAIVPIMTDIGDRFSSFELFLPDMMRAADVVKAIHAALSEALQDTAEPMESPGTIAIGTVSGDVHDIGKNIVATMLEVNGFNIVDLGVNVSAPDFIRRAREANADIIALSSLMTTSIPYMQDVVDLVKESDKDRARFKILVGGGPVTPEVAAKMGADAYGRDAAEAVREARNLMEATRSHAA